MNVSTLIEAHLLSMTYADGTKALNSINLQIYRGEFISVVGPSGCGKSTFLRLVAGLNIPTTGKLSIAGEKPVEARRSLAFVFQEAQLLPWRNSLDNVRLPLELMGMVEKEQLERSYHTLQSVGLGDFTNSYPHQLSGGMKMRVSLARALVTHPQIMLFDEPFAAVDEITRQYLNEEILELWQKEQWTALFVTHNIYEAVFLSSRLLVMGPRPGSIIADFNIPFSYPRSPQLREKPEFVRFVGEINRLLRKQMHVFPERNNNARN